MSDYTPTTEEVFHCYQYCSIMEDPESAHEAEPQFDRWLESNMQKMQIAERERIIKLLEAESSSIFSLPYVIVLIKGENK
jgi:hypothetical protein